MTREERMVEYIQKNLAFARNVHKEITFKVMIDPETDMKFLLQTITLNNNKEGYVFHLYNLETKKWIRVYEYDMETEYIYTELHNKLENNMLTEVVAEVKTNGDIVSWVNYTQQPEQVSG